MVEKVVVDKHELNFPFRVTVKWMHGDADHFDDEVYEMRDEQEVLDFLELADAYFAGEWDDGREREMVEALPHYDDFFGGDPWPWDVVYSESLARMDKIVRIEYYVADTWCEIKKI
jgi:hypothetical protein